MKTGPTKTGINEDEQHGFIGDEVTNGSLGGAATPPYRLLVGRFLIDAGKQSYSRLFQAGIALAGDVLHVLAWYREFGQQSSNLRVEVRFWQWLCRVGRKFEITNSEAGIIVLRVEIRGIFRDRLQITGADDCRPRV